MRILLTYPVADAQLIFVTKKTCFNIFLNQDELILLVTAKKNNNIIRISKLINHINKKRNKIFLP